MYKILQYGIRTERNSGLVAKDELIVDYYSDNSFDRVRSVWNVENPKLFLDSA